MVNGDGVELALFETGDAQHGRTSQFVEEEEEEQDGEEGEEVGAAQLGDALGQSPDERVQEASTSSLNTRHGGAAPRGMLLKGA